jgi:hypothetical protein
MFKRQLLTISVAASLLTIPVLAQAASDEQNGHHYQGGPKTETSHNMKHPQAAVNTGTVGQAATNNGHHYNGGPKTETIHHMGEKK